MQDKHHFGNLSIWFIIYKATNPGWLEKAQIWCQILKHCDWVETHDLACIQSLYTQKRKLTLSCLKAWIEVKLLARKIGMQALPLKASDCSCAPCSHLNLHVIYWTFTEKSPEKKIECSANSLLHRQGMNGSCSSK